MLARRAQSMTGPQLRHCHSQHTVRLTQSGRPPLGSLPLNPPDPQAPMRCQPIASSASANCRTSPASTRSRLWRRQSGGRAGSATPNSASRGKRQLAASRSPGLLEARMPAMRLPSNPSVGWFSTPVRWRRSCWPTPGCLQKEHVPFKKDERRVKRRAFRFHTGRFSVSFVPKATSRGRSTTIAGWTPPPAKPVRSGAGKGAAAPAQAR